jgi:sugar lactone lactonase YvrE
LNEEVMDGPGAGTEDVSTFVGATGQYGFSDGQGDQARFNCPSGITTNSEGDIFVCDYFNHAVRKITTEGLVTTVAGSPGHSGKSDGQGRRARFNHPHGIVADPFGNLFLCDYFNHTIRKIDSKGEVTTIAGIPGRKGYTDGPGATAKFYHPQDLAIDLDGNLFVTDQMNYVVRKVTPQGDVSTVAGTPGQPGSRDGNPANKEAAMFNHPSGIAVDYYGNLFVCDTYNNTIRKVSKKGEVSTIAGMAGQSRSIDGDASHARFSRPYGITIDRDGNLFISDTFNQSIRKFSANDCKVTTISESSGWCESVSNGVIHYPKLNFPFGVAVSREGFLYVTDSHNYVVRRIQLQEQANQGPQSLSKVVFETLVLKKDWEGLAKFVEEETAESISQEKLKGTFSYSTTAFINSLIQLSLVRSGEKLNEAQEKLAKENKQHEERMAAINKDKNTMTKEIEELEKKLKAAKEKFTTLLNKEKEAEKTIAENEKHTKLNNLKKAKITMQLENITESSTKEAAAYIAFKAILKEKPFRTWETNEVCQLLKEIGLKHHIHNFISNQMTGAKVVDLNSTKLVSIFNFTFRESKQLISTIDLIGKKKNIYRSPVGVLAWSNEQVIEWLQENNLSHLIPICKVKQIAGEELLYLDEEDMTLFLQVDVPQLQMDFEYKLDKLRKEDRSMKKQLKVNLSAEKADKQSPFCMAVQRFKMKNTDNMAKIKKFKDRMPSEFFCSLCGELLADPVFASDSQIYERSIIEAWMSKYDTSPIVGTKFKSKLLETSNVLKNLIETFLRELV